MREDCVWCVCVCVCEAEVICLKILRGIGDTGGVMKFIGEGFVGMIKMCRGSSIVDGCELSQCGGDAEFFFIQNVDSLIN